MHLTGTALPRPVPFQPSPAVDVCLAADPAPPVPYSAVQCSAVQRTTIYRYSHRSFAVARAVHHDLHRKSYLHRKSLGRYTRESSQSDEEKVTLLPIHLQQHQAGLQEDPHWPDFRPCQVLSESPTQCVWVGTRRRRARHHTLPDAAAGSPSRGHLSPTAACISPWRGLFRYPSTNASPREQKVTLNEAIAHTTNECI